MFAKYVTKGTIGAALTVLAVVAGAFHQGTLATYLGSPETATAIWAFVTSGLAIYAGVAQGVAKTPAA